MNQQMLIRFFTALLISGSFAFYLGKHFDRRLLPSLVKSPMQSPFAPMSAGIR